MNSSTAALGVSVSLRMSTALFSMRLLLSTCFRRASRFSFRGWGFLGIVECLAAAVPVVLLLFSLWLP